MVKLEPSITLRRLPAGGVGQAEMDALAAHAGHAVVGIAEERFGLRLPDELHAFFLGVRHLALRARHVGAVAAIDAVHGDGALAARRCARNPSPCRRRR